jgi:hypothetical protein
MDGIAEANHDFAEWITSIEADARVDGQRLGSLLQVRCSSVNKERQYGPEVPQRSWHLRITALR